MSNHFTKIDKILCNNIILHKTTILPPFYFGKSEGLLTMESYSSIYLINVHKSATEKDVFQALNYLGNGDDSIVFHYPQQNAWSIMKFNFEGEGAIENIIALKSGIIIPVPYSYTLINDNYGGIPRRKIDTMYIQINNIENITSNHTLNILSELRKEKKISEELETHLTEAMFDYED